MATWISKNPDMFAGLLLLAVLAVIFIIKAIVDATSKSSSRTVNPNPDTTQRVENVFISPMVKYASILSNGNAMGNGNAGGNPAGMGNVGGTGAGFSGGRLGHGKIG